MEQYFSSFANVKSPNIDSKKSVAQVRSLTNRLKRGLSHRASTLFDTGKFSLQNKSQSQLPRLKISFPLERTDNAQPTQTQESATSGWMVVSTPPTSPTSSGSSSPFQSPSSSVLSSASSRTSYSSGFDGYFPSAGNEKKVTFAVEPTRPLSIGRRESVSSRASSEYAEEGELPPPIVDGEIMNKIGVNRFAAAEYIKEIEGTPMILVDGKLYL